MDALFVLVPEVAALERLLDALPAEFAAARAQLVLRVYPRASDARHLLGLVRAGRDPVATRRGRGLVACVLGGALLGALTAGALAVFDMLGGLELALPFGLFVGAFLGAFTGAMTGTEVARDEVRALAASLRAGDMLASIAGDADALTAIAAQGDAAGYACRRRG